MASIEENANKIQKVLDKHNIEYDREVWEDDKNKSISFNLIGKGGYEISEYTSMSLSTDEEDECNIFNGYLVDCGGFWSEPSENVSIEDAVFYIENIAEFQKAFDAAEKFTSNPFEYIKENHKE